MNRREIEAMLESDSGTYSEDYDDTDADPNWSSENEPDENIYEHESSDNYNVTINMIGINLDIIECLTQVLSTFFYLFFDKEIIDMLVVEKNRFEIILSMLNIFDNDNAPTNDRLYKIQILIDLLVEKFNSAIIPEESICIDESMVPYLGCLSFRQYISNKRHRYGVKIFKLCTRDFYTSKYKIYAGKEATTGDSVSCKVVMELMEPYLNFGRTLYADNWYNSIDLAEKLLRHKTHLVGTLRSNRKRNPKDVTQKKLNRGEIFAKRSDCEIMVLKWRDHRDVLMISTKHSNTMEEVMTKRIKIKPKVVINYNRDKGYIDLSDQMGSYSSCLRGMKCIFKEVTGNSKTIIQFKDDIINELIQQSNSGPEVLEVLEPYDEYTNVDSKKANLSHINEICPK
ncbi:piggyBac transposable element-derived protein 4-like [Sipha flava]|uniref:PiggyBac transposable element-derived protein 4-like n=1 Tax=Sipha flava TaxID=143950 RepID=A0A8B8FT64_9HEMI|nr:piggyBac transposable element-derived protein 4-like [Sipha flava]